MKYFLDSAKIEEIRYAYKHWGIDGVTTNPRHIMLSGKSLITVLNELSVEFKDIKFPISVEINPYLEKHEDMIEEAKKIASISENFVIKVPCTEEGLIAAKNLTEQGVKTNVTLVFSASQAIQAGRINSYFVSPFIGWKENSGEDCSQYIQDISSIYKTYGIKTEIIVAAIRTGKQIVDAARVGADIVTCGFQVFKDSFAHPFTDYGLDVFRKSWDGTKKGE